MPAGDASSAAPDKDQLLIRVLEDFIVLDPSAIPPTCSCILAVDLGVPTKVAQLLLEHFVAEGKMARAELKELAVKRRDLRRGLSDGEAESIQRFPGSLSVYFDRRDISRTHELFPPLVIQLALMFRILNQALFADLARLKWNFQVATKVLRNGGTEPSDYPVAKLAEDLLGADGKKWREEHLQGRRRFEELESNRSTQLRILMHLALQLAGGDYGEFRPWNLNRLRWSTPRRRAEIVDRLGRLLIEGLEVPQGHRSAYSRRILPDMALTPQDRNPWSATGEWYALLDRRKERTEEGVWRRWLHRTLTELPPRSQDDLPESIRKALSADDDEQVARRGFWHATLADVG